MSVRAIGFDAMGTLFDFHGMMSTARARIEEVLQGRGRPAGEFNQLHKTVRPMITSRLEDMNVRASYRDKLIACFDEHMSGEMKKLIGARETVEMLFSECSRVPIFDDVVPALRTLAERKYPLGILSNADPDWFVESLASIPVSWRVVVRVNWLVQAKPTKEAFDQLARGMGLNAHDVLYVGDDFRCDVVGALEAGMHAVFISRGGAVPDVSALRQAHPERLVATVSDLSSIVDVLSAYEAVRPESPA